MNWTEGSLARHSKGKHFNDDVARQKRHFARARAQRAPSTAAPALDASSFVPDYLSGGDDVAAAPKLPAVPDPPVEGGDAPGSLRERKFRLLGKSDWAGIKAAAAAAPQKQWKNPLDPEGTLLTPGPPARLISEHLPAGFYSRRAAAAAPRRRGRVALFASARRPLPGHLPGPVPRPSPPPLTTGPRRQPQPQPQQIATTSRPPKRCRVDAVLCPASAAPSNL